MDAAEVEVSHEERDRGGVVGPLLREGTCQTGHPLVERPNREVGALDDRRADARLIGLSVKGLLLRGYYRRRAVLPPFFLWRLAVFFDQLGSIDAHAELLDDDVRVAVPAVAGQLEPTIGRTVQALDKFVAGGRVAVAGLVRHDHLGVALDGQERPDVTALRIVDPAPVERALLAAVVAPDLVQFDVVDRHVTDVLDHEAVHLVADELEQPADGVAMRSGDPLNGADAGALDE